jgi:hypothetical protein
MMATAEQVAEAHNIWKISNGRIDGKWMVYNTKNNVALYLISRKACIAFIEQQVAPTL